MLVKTSYTFLYNWDNKDENGLCGMGKESGTVSGGEPMELMEFLRLLQYNSQIKPDGSPRYFIVDIKIEPVDE
jgi:hypothetical protein